jgi:hypothetical protein
MFITAGKTLRRNSNRMHWAFLFFILSAAPSVAADHPCAGDARQRADKLLRFHFVLEAGDPVTKLANDEVLNMGIDDKVGVLAPIKALRGKGKLDVLEVWGSIYKANYRMRFIYAQFDGSCTLMGQEILEESDPY